MNVNETKLVILAAVELRLFKAIFISSICYIQRNIN